MLGICMRRSMNRKKAKQADPFSDANGVKNQKNSANGISIVPVNTHKDLKIFYNLPFEIYRTDAQWVAPFWLEFKAFFNKKNPLWSHAQHKLFIVRRGHKTVGRIAAIIDELYCKTQKDRIGFFGFFECTNDFDCAKALFHGAEQWLSTHGIRLMQGPIDGRIDMGCGFLLEGYDTPTTLLSSYSKDYYIPFCEKYQMIKSRDFFEYRIDLTTPLPDALVEKAHRCSTQGITIRPFNRLRTNRELNWWVSLFLDTFETHWGYVPVSEQEVKVRFGVNHLRWTVDPRLFLVAEYNGSPIAYLWATPDYNQLFRYMHGRLGILEYITFLSQKKYVDVGKLHFIGIKEKLRHHSIGSALNYYALEEMKKRSYKSAAVGVIDEHNKTAHDTIKLTGATISRTFRVYEKTIVPS